ncbi:hypothetical protein A2U01_0053738, partial [Trifolium medium]|nr:hypothetical protein [Trifolium medium]
KGKQNIPFPTMDPLVYGAGADRCNGLYGLPAERRPP